MSLDYENIDYEITVFTNVYKAKETQILNFISSHISLTKLKWYLSVKTKRSNHITLCSRSLFTLCSDPEVLFRNLRSWCCFTLPLPLLISKDYNTLSLCYNGFLIVLGQFVVSVSQTFMVTLLKVLKLLKTFFKLLFNYHLNLYCT